MIKGNHSLKGFSPSLSSVFCLMLWAGILFGLLSCQQDSGDAGSSSADTTAPTTTIEASSFCTQDDLAVYDCSSTPISITFTANEAATIFYAEGTSSGVSVDTDSESVESGSSIEVTGAEGAIVYIAFFAEDIVGNTETARELSVTIPDFTDPVTTISFVIAADSSSDCDDGDSVNEYICEGPITVTFTVSDNTNANVYYETNTETETIPTTSSSVYTAPFAINTNDTYLTFFAQDRDGNQESYQSYYFEIEGISSSINGGYYNTDQNLTFEVSDNRDLSGDAYQLYYLQKTGTDVSTDATSDVVFSSGASPTANSEAVRYLNTYTTYPAFEDTTAETIDVSADNGDTAIYLYRYNLIYGGSQDASGDVQNGTVDKESTLVVYIDKDTPKAVAVPPSSGTLGSSISYSMYYQDNGADKIEEYASTNSALTDATPIQSPTTSYCKTTDSADMVSPYWDSCTNDSDNTSGDLTSGQSDTVTVDTLVSMRAQDPAENYIACDPTNDDQYNCYVDSSSGEDYFAELYTPGIQQSSYYHQSENIADNSLTNFGYAVATGDFDNDGSSDIAIGAPAYSYTAASNNLSKGAVYVWYNGFRERAILQLIDNDVNTDVTDKYMQFTTDSFDSLRIYLDPSTDTSSYSNDYLQADTGDYNDKTSATASEIATVLNQAFLSSYNKSYQNYLYADASTDGKLSIGHINRTIYGSFAYTSNFDTTSDMYYAGNAIKAYDYVIYGEEDGSEFGYSIAIGPVDTSTDTSTYSSSQLVVGAPGRNTDDGALYVIMMPASSTLANYGTVTLVDSTTDAYMINDASADGRLGHAIYLYDDDNDGTSDIYTSAPFYDYNGNIDAGVIYEIKQRDFVPSDTSYSISATADYSYGWRGPDQDDSSADNALMGFSLIAGWDSSTSPTSGQYLYAGAPGKSGGTTDGKVLYFDLDYANPFGLSKPKYHYVLGGTTGNLFGYSLDILNSGFDTSSTSKCPCLVVGAPGADSGAGNVWIQGRLFGTYIQGASNSSEIGISVLADAISGTADSLFITGRGDSDAGYLITASPQALATDVTTDTPDDLAGNRTNDHLGVGLALISVDGTRAVVSGAPGDGTAGAGDKYKVTGSSVKTGSVKIISGSRF